MPPEIRKLFRYAERGDRLALSNSISGFNAQITQRGVYGVAAGRFVPARGVAVIADFISDVQAKFYDYRAAEDLRLQTILCGTPWETVKELDGAFNCFATGGEKYSALFGREIIDSIPAGSIYLGGTDPGRFVITAMCHSQPAGDPFFVLTQNELADESYRQYLQEMYGTKIYIPTVTDQEACFRAYAAEIKAKPTEPGLIGIMKIRALLAKVVFDKNPDREFYLEESFPLDWMYPYLEPHGLIFKINRQPVAKFSDETLRYDHDFWTNQINPMIGSWLDDKTTVKAIAAFAEKTFARHDFSGFAGDTNFIQNGYSQRMFSKSRSAIAGLYAWRAQNVHDESEKQRMIRAADFAFRQSWGLCPDSPEVIFRYINFLLMQNHIEDALLVAETAAALPQSKDNDQLPQVVTQLKRWRVQSPSAATSGSK